MGCHFVLRLLITDHYSLFTVSWQAVGLPGTTVLWKCVFERRRFRQFLPSLAEWCAAYRGKGGEDGRRP